MSRSRNQQPTYDFLAGGGDAQHPLVERRQRSTSVARPGQASASDDELRDKLHKLEYEVDALKQERELTNIRHDEELRALQTKAEEDFKRAQTHESSNSVSLSRYEKLVEELREAREEATLDKTRLEDKLRATVDRNTALEEQLEEGRTELTSQERQFTRDISDLQSRCETIERASEEARLENERLVKALESTQSRLAKREDEVAQLENEMMRIKTQSGDSTSVDILQRELSEQMEHIKNLESLNQGQSAELSTLRQQQGSIEVAQEEKKALEFKVARMNDLRRELNETQLQKSILEEEKREWTAFLESEPGLDEAEIETPQDLAKAFMRERMQRLTLLEELGRIKPDALTKDDTIASLEATNSELQEEMAALKQSGAGGPSDAKARARLERQRALAAKEVDYLRAQIKALDSEEAEMTPEKFDEAKSQRIEELEKMLDEHRKELEQLHQEMSRIEMPASTASPMKTPLKRARDDGADERVGELTRKNRTLQDELNTVANARKILEKELDVAKSQLRSLKKGSSKRILELRNNPTSQVAAIKQAALDTLRAENEALLAKLELRKDQENMQVHTVPSATLERLRQDLAAKDVELASAVKHTLRLKQIFAAKSNEFREAVASILGWKMDFMPNGRVRVTSMFYPGQSDDDEANSIVFDGEQGTMKVSGGPQSAFAGEIRSQIEFWVEGRKEIPCFLSALTLEFWERTTRAQKV